VVDRLCGDGRVKSQRWLRLLAEMSEWCHEWKLKGNKEEHLNQLSLRHSEFEVSGFSSCADLH